MINRLLPRTLLNQVALLLLAICLMTVSAAAQTVTQGYSVDSSIQRATIVSVKLDEASRIEPASIDNHERLQGVVVDKNDAPFTLSGENEQTFVATTGRFETFVSTENGAVLPGDFIAVSRVAGIGMKASDEEPYIIGKAISGFDGTQNVLSTTAVSFGNADAEVAIGRVQVDIGVGGNPLLKPTRANVPSFLERLAENIADKPVDPVRIYVSMGVFFATAIISGVLLYSGVRSSMISVGRNPLSKKSVIRGLIQIIVTSLIILLLGVFAVYLLLRL